MSNIDSMLLPELKKVAGSLGIKGAGSMRKAELQAAIRAAQGSGSGSKPSTEAVEGAQDGGSRRPPRTENAEQKKEERSTEAVAEREASGSAGDAPQTTWRPGWRRCTRGRTP